MDRLDDLIDNGKINWFSIKYPLLVKIDTEGCDLDVIKGFGKYIEDVDYLIVEIGNYENNGFDAIDLYSYLKQYGFNNSRILYSVVYEGTAKPYYMDVLFWR
jgi:hypothetical protein